MSARRGVPLGPDPRKAWMAREPRVSYLTRGEYGRSQSFTARVRALHHWIRKGEPGRAAAAAYWAFHQAGRILRQGRDG